MGVPAGTSGGWIVVGVTTGSTGFPVESVGGTTAATGGGGTMLWAAARRCC